MINLEPLSAHLVGRHLKRLREKRGITQGDLASLAGLARATVSRLETGAYYTIQPETVNALARALGVSPRTLTKEERGSK